MRWTERQRAMLREMGIALWEREPLAGHDPDVGDGAADDAMVATAERRSSARTAEAKDGCRTGGGGSAVASGGLARPATGPEAALASAEWLVVGDRWAVDDVTAADQERLLDNMLGAIGVSRSAPARSRRAAYFGLPEAGGGGGPAPSAALDAAIAAAQPACILALGRAAAQAVLDTDERLGALRGRRETRAGIPVIATFAPAFLLRHPIDKAKAWADLCLAVRCLDEAA